MNYIGEIKLFAGEFNPPGFIDCDGEAYPVSLYRELFAILGYVHTPEIGGRGGKPERLKYFRVPTMDGLIQGTKYIICVEGYFPREAFLEIYENSTGNLAGAAAAAGQTSTPLKDYQDPKGKKLTRYDQTTWQNYNLDTDEFEDSGTPDSPM